jgi:heme/copper-type cytochrome/quinol oxidase subunit 2
MWGAGAVCFFAAWGRTGSEEADGFFSFNLILGLIIIMVLGELFVINPVIRLASGKKVIGEERKGAMLLLHRPLHVMKVTIIIWLIVMTYYVMNAAIISIYSLDEQSVPVHLEPILFGILYGLYYLLYDFIVKITFGKFFPDAFGKEST